MAEQTAQRGRLGAGCPALTPPSGPEEEQASSSSAEWLSVKWRIRPQAPLRGRPLTMELPTRPTAQTPVNYPVNWFSNWQTQVHSRETKELPESVLPSSFPEAAPHRRHSQPQDRKQPASPRPVAPRQAGVSGSWDPGATTCLDFWFTLTCTPGSLSSSPWEQ